MIGSTTALLAATIAFAGGHFLLSHPLRMPLIGALGEKPFRGVYALVAGATFAWMLFAYGAAPRLPLWGKAEWMRAPLIALMRHPMNWAFALWALGHLVMNGDSATVILTAGIAFLALVGSWAQERRKAAQMRAAWQGFAARTSFIPLVAIAQGRARFSLRETGYGRIAGGVVLWAILLHVHRYIIGVSPFGG